MQEGMEIITTFGYVTYTTEESGSEVVTDYLGSEHITIGYNAVLTDTMLGIDYREIRAGTSLKKIKWTARQIAFDDKAMTDFLATQLTKWGKTNWYAWPSVRNGTPSEEARQWLWRETYWCRWDEPQEVNLPNWKSVSRRTPKIRKQHTDYVTAPPREESRRFDTYYVVPSCDVNAYVSVVYPEDGVGRAEEIKKI